MLRNAFERRRRGAALVEFSVVAPVLFFFILSLFAGGLGVFYCNEVSHLAREGARYASTHGGQYKRDKIDVQTGVPQILTSADLLPVLQQRASLLDPNQLQVALSYSIPPQFSPSNYPSYDDTNPALVPPGQKVIYNNVTVTVRYPWTPLFYGAGTFTLASTSTMPMSY